MAKYDFITRTHQNTYIKINKKTHTKKICGQITAIYINSKSTTKID